MALIWKRVFALCVAVLAFLTVISLIVGWFLQTFGVTALWCGMGISYTLSALHEELEKLGQRQQHQQQRQAVTHQSAQQRVRSPDPVAPTLATASTTDDQSRSTSRSLRSVLGAVVAPRRSTKPPVPGYWCYRDDHEGGQVHISTEVHWQRRFKRLFRHGTTVSSSAAFEIENVWRCEQPRLYGLYAAHRDTQLRSRPPVLAAPLTSVAIAPEWLVELGLRSTQANEVMLWHGTKLEHIHSIMQEGFDERVGRLSGLFGAGVYFAEDPAKADQYTGPGDSDGGEPVHRLMFLSRVSLGAFAEVQDVTLDARRPPDGFDSVVGCADGAFREFVTYDGWLAYPEFLVQYVRITK